MSVRAGPEHPSGRGSPPAPPVVSRRRPGAGWAVFLVAMVQGSSASPASSAPLPLAPPPHASVPFDLGRVVEQVHFAYRQEGRSWTSGHWTYGVRVDNESLAFKPYHYPQGAPGDEGQGTPSEPAMGIQAVALAPTEAREGEPVRFGAAAVQRGGRTAGAAAGKLRQGARGELLRGHGDVVETLSNSGQGVEQAWRFETLPAGAGPLDVRIPILAGRFVGATASGLHFQAGALLVRYGHGTWVDAEGRTSAVPARFDRGAIVLRVPEDVLLRSKFPAVLDPVIGPEFQMDAPTLGPAANVQSFPKTASDGTNFFVVWQDLRSGNTDIHGARVSAAGGLLDTSSIAISTDASAQTSPAVAWDGTNFLVVWQDLRTGTADIYGARVSAAGLVLDAAGLVISSAAGGQSAPAVDWDGANYFVVWEDLRTGPADIYGARVSPTGAVLDAAGIAVSTAANAQSVPSVAWDGANHVVVWQDLRAVATWGIYAARVSPAGALQDATGIAISTSANCYSPAVSSNGTNSLIVWEDFRSGNPDVYGARLSPAGALLDASGIAISRGAPFFERYPAVANGGSDYLVAWQDDRGGAGYDIYGARVSGGGAVQDAAGIALSTAVNVQSSPAVAWNGTSFLAVWQDLRSGTTADISGARVTVAGTVQDAAGIALSTLANGELRPAAASDGTDYLVVWQESRDGIERDIYGVRVSGAGVVLDAAGFAISTAANVQSSPAVAWTGTSYLVAWEDLRGGTFDYDIWGARVSPGGAVQDATGFAISTAVNSQYAPAIACSGTNCLVVWEDVRGIDSDIYGARVSLAGAVLDPAGIALCTLANAQADAAVAWDGTNYLVVWEDYRSGTTYDIYGARVSTAGAVLDAAGIAVSAAANSQVYPAIAWGGASYLVAWHDSRAGPDWDIYGARVSAAGTVLDPAGIAVSTAAFAQSFPAVAWGGVNYLVVWQDYRTDGVNGDLYSARVSDVGAVLDPAGVPVSTSAVTERTVRMASHGNNEGLVVYQRLVSSTGVPNLRAWGRMVTFEAAPLATPQSVTLAEDTGTAFTLAGSDADGDALTFAVVSPPTQGTLTGTGPSYTYTPAANFHGPDAFTFQANDGFLSSAPAIVSLTVTAVNDTPVATAQAVTTSADASVAITLAGTDVDGDALTFAVLNQPAKGTLTGTGANVTYTPAANSSGADAFTFVANDGALDSAPATVSITTTLPPPNVPPSVPTLVTPAEGANVPAGDATFSWTASADPEGGPVGYRLELTRGAEAPRLLSSATTSLALSGADGLAAGLYSWRVEALDGTGLSSGFSPARTFRVPRVMTVGCGCASGPEPLSLLSALVCFAALRRSRRAQPQGRRFAPR